MSEAGVYRRMKSGSAPSSWARVIASAGFWSASASFVGVLGYGAVQVLQVLGGVGGPLGDALIFATSLLIAPPFLVAMLALQHFAPEERKFFSHGAVSFATLYAGFALFIYVVQLGSVIPASLSGSAPPVLLVTPHSLFWTVDALAYICMGAAALLAFPLFDRHGPDESLRLALLAHAVMTPFIAIVYFYPAFSIALLMLGSPWLLTALAVTGLLARHFRRIRSAC